MGNNKVFEKINLQFATNYTFQRVIKFYESSLELSDDYGVFTLRYLSKNKIDREKFIDTEENWERVPNEYECTFLKKNIVSVELEYEPATKANENVKDLWKLTISIAGMSSDITIKFHEELPLKEVHKKVISWWLNIE